MTTSDGVENNQSAPKANSQNMTTEQLLIEIYENTRKTKQYMQWSMYITIVFVVLPLLAALFVIPFAMKSLTTVYSGLLQ